MIIVPHSGEFPMVGERILIAWKDSRESARAVADALPSAAARARGDGDGDRDR